MSGRKSTEVSKQADQLEVGEEMKVQTSTERFRVYDLGRRRKKKFQTTAITGGFRVKRVA